jgi:hypothetical protein
MKYLKLYEQFSEDDPFGEDLSLEEELYIISVLGQDEFFISKKVKRNIGRFYDFEYLIMEINNGNYEFSYRAYVNSNSAYSLNEKEKEDVLNGNKLVGYVDRFNRTYFKKLEEICQMTNVNINNINFL